ncbi:MAG: hypothetical protein GY950_33010, partial [bacterium]|nr:hypothetical protein [bacterium]
LFTPFEDVVDVAAPKDARVIVGQLINYAQEKEEKNECIATEDIVAILSNHIKSSRVIGYPPKRFKGQGESQKFNTTKKVSDIPDTLAKSFSDWLNEIKIGKKGKHSEEKTITLNEPIFPLAGEDWETCFVRRLHGEYLLSDFWRNLENVYFDILPLKEGKSKSDRIKTIRTVIRGWGSVLGDYWADENSDNGKDVYWVRAVLMQCPIFEKLLRVKRGVKATGRKISQKKRLEVRKGVFDE